jgi:hypothetical protein
LQTILLGNTQRCLDLTKPRWSIGYPLNPDLDLINSRCEILIKESVQVKEEVDQLLKAGFIRPCIYAEWVSNIMPMEKKNKGKIRVCADFRNLNMATPKDEYSMPVAEVLITNASGHGLISFLDGNVGIIRFSGPAKISARQHSDAQGS